VLGWGASAVSECCKELSCSALLYCDVLYCPAVLYCVACCRQAYDAFLVVHGTDTMAYTASALSLMLVGELKWHQAATHAFNVLSDMLAG